MERYLPMGLGLLALGAALFAGWLMAMTGFSLFRSDADGMEQFASAFPIAALICGAVALILLSPIGAAADQTRTPDGAPDTETDDEGGSQ